MAYIVLALGAFLSIGGALSIFHGAGIVEVERGWTGVIAGASALTGGIVTIALGLILKTLLDLRPMLAARAGAQAMPTNRHDAQTNHPLGQNVDRPAAPTAFTPVGAPTSLMTAELEGGMLAAMLAPGDEPVEAERPFGAPAEHPKVSSLPVADTFDTPRAGGDLALGEREEPVAVGVSVPEPESDKPRFKINFKRQPPASLPPEPTPIDVVEEEPAMDDWLDRAFSALDAESPLTPLAAPHHSPEPAPVRVAEPVSHEEPAVALADAQPRHAVRDPEPVLPAASSPTSSVIGRYEADGTAYVMYADGSIEAQSDAGVYRFNSMTELKAFIENA